MSEEFTINDFFWDCMFEYTEIAMNQKLITEEEHLNEPLHKAFYDVMNFYFASDFLERKWQRGTLQFGNAVNWYCFYSGLLLEKIREENPDKLQETLNSILTGKLDPIEEIDKYKLKYDTNVLSKLCFAINEKGNELRSKYEGDKTKLGYIEISYLASIELGSAIQEEMRP